jgi:DNA modification methylase
MAEQGKLGIKADQKIDSVEDYKFEPIKGYPMLSWKGKRPFSSTQYYPAQLKETYGEEVSGWINKIFWGDNLQVMSHLLKNFRGQIDLIYIDPPFDSKADYKKRITLKGKQIVNDQNSFEEKQYTDLWSNDEYLQFMFERLTLLRELLSDRGSIWLHCDWRKVHHLRLILDEIFGPTSFKACVTWRTMTSSGYKGKSSMGRSHADILYYTKGDNFTYNPEYTPMNDNMRSRYIHSDPDGRLFKDSYLGDVTSESLKELEKENLVYWTSNKTPRIKHYLDEAKGIIVDDVWTDINPTNSQSYDQTGYPTQKPEMLLERILKICSNPGDLVLDCFMGSGTTQATAMRLGRKFIGADINLGSIQTATKRLLTLRNDLLSQLQENTLFTSFQVLNVNHYDVFRNPIEAKDLVIKALEIQPLPGNSIYDGEKDGKMVKVMPVNRIATRVDLNQLITGFDYKVFEKRNEKAPGKAVENILLVCMGHEPDLGAFLKEQIKASGFLIDVEVVDILRDKANLEFKRDSEAEATVESDKLVIRQFYPMNLLQKLSLMKENVQDWRELVESVMVDFNYDGSVFEPQMVDVPEGKDLVKGFYPIPAKSGTIRVKITDLLSESLEVTVNG